MTSSFISFSQTTDVESNKSNNVVSTEVPVVSTPEVVGDITPDKVVTDSLSGKTYWMWETTKAKEIAKCLDKGLIDAEKVNALNEKMVIMEDRDKQCKNINDSLLIANNKANEIIKNNEQIRTNDKEIIVKHEEISTKKDALIQKQDGKIKRKNSTIKTLLGTNIVTIAILILIIL